MINLGWLYKIGGGILATGSVVAFTFLTFPTQRAADSAHASIKGRIGRVDNRHREQQKEIRARLIRIEKKIDNLRRQ